MTATQPYVTEPTRSVLFIAPQPYMSDRGSPFRVHSTITALSQLGFQVDLLVLPIGSDCSTAGVRLHRSPRFLGLKTVPIGPSWTKALLDIGLLLKAIRLAACNHYDVVHAVEEAGVIARVLQVFYKRPFIFDMHSSMPEQFLSSQSKLARLLAPPFGVIERMCIRNASAVITVSDRISEYAKKLSPEIVVATLNDLPLVNTHTPSPLQLSDLIKQHRLTGKKVFLYTGNFKEYQGVPLLLEAFSRMQSEIAEQDSVLLLVGGGREEQKTLRRLKRQAERLGIRQRTIFTGQLPGEQMEAFMQIADVLISPRISGDNTPLKVYSYMQSKKPVVATNISSHTQVLDETCAYLADPTPHAFAQAMKSALEESSLNTQQAKQKIQEASRRVKEDFGPEKFSEKLRTVYQCIWPDKQETIPSQTSKVLMEQNSCRTSRSQ